MGEISIDIAGLGIKISAADLRKWAVEYLNERDNELVRFPDLAGTSHWNLWMMDAELEEVVSSPIAA